MFKSLTLLFPLKQSFLHKTPFVFCVLLLLCITCPFAAHAQGNLLLFPKRLVFEGTKKSQDLILQNIGDDSATFLISFTLIKMMADGSIVQLTEPDTSQHNASDNIRFYPRQVKLAPKESQVVKVQVIKSNELQTGEYRSHLYFRAVPKPHPLGETPPVNDSAISVRIVPIFGISIPVIIRKGSPTTAISISDVQLQFQQDTLPLVHFTIHRTGNMSAYGDIRIDHISAQGKVTRMGEASGLAVYSSNPLRNVIVALKHDPLVDLHKGKLHVVFAAQGIQQIAQREIYLQ